ncbi:NUDIX hydrolase [Melghirimyces algeriensis]|uniref:Isopentenyldiphosphate isomerase n=1 Tax=Melghirimyces algeriensis TaxID=910412 RepID=A0A521ERE3_9BACL|nr:NUDIX domain-containing protein [Melghirimyces algeriensis]SMO85670.1 Isopentenyldiphosphate isomerase [Melghirimyces algeriensis]
MDANRNIIGTADRECVHREGLWHQTFHCWLFREEKGKIRLLLQLRHPDKKAHPNHLDVTAAGHLLHGEQISDGVRELEEELGIKAHYRACIPLGIWREEIIGDGWIDREFIHVHLYECHDRIQTFQLQPEEVSGLFEVELPLMEQLIQKEKVEAELTGTIQLEDGRHREEKRRVTLQDFVPYSPGYYQMVLKALKEITGDER